MKGFLNEQDRDDALEKLDNELMLFFDHKIDEELGSEIEVQVEGTFQTIIERLYQLKA